MLYSKKLPCSEILIVIFFFKQTDYREYGLQWIYACESLKSIVWGSFYIINLGILLLWTKPWNEQAYVS